MYDWEDEFDGGEPEGGPVPQPIVQPSPEQVMREWITKASFWAAAVLVGLEIFLAVIDAACGAQIAASSFAAAFAGIMIANFAWYFAG